MQDGFVDIDGVFVDIPALLAISYKCDPTLCRGGKGCCSYYEISLPESELSRVIGYLPGASCYAPGLKSANPAESDCYDNLFDEAEGDELIIDTDENDLCRLAYSGAEGETFCSLHTAALKMGVSYFDAKPRCCVLWPLAIADERPLRITVQPDAYEFPCCSRSETGELSAGIAEILAGVFGDAFLSRALALIDQRKAWSVFRGADLPVRR